METPVLKLMAAALASAIACAGILPAAAAPAFIPYAPNVQSQVVPVMDSAIIRRDRRHDRDKRRHRRDDRRHARDHDDGSGNFRPKATPKHAYDADGDYRIYHGDGWEDEGRRKNRDRRKKWNRWNDRDHKKRPRLYKLHSFGFQPPAPSPALKDILTAVPD